MNIKCFVFTKLVVVCLLAASLASCQLDEERVNNTRQNSAEAENRLKMVQGELADLENKERSLAAALKKSQDDAQVAESFYKQTRERASKNGLDPDNPLQAKETAKAKTANEQAQQAVVNAKDEHSKAEAEVTKKRAEVEAAQSASNKQETLAPKKLLALGGLLLLVALVAGGLIVVRKVTAKTGLLFSRIDDLEKKLDLLLQRIERLSPDYSPKTSSRSVVENPGDSPKTNFSGTSPAGMSLVVEEEKAVKPNQPPPTPEHSLQTEPSGSTLVSSLLPKPVSEPLDSNSITEIFIPVFADDFKHFHPTAFFVSYDAINQVLRKDPNGSNEFLLSQINESELFHAVPSGGRLGQKEIFFTYYKTHYECSNPSRGRILIEKPAEVLDTQDGWKLKEKGIMRIERASS